MILLCILFKVCFPPKCQCSHIWFSLPESPSHVFFPSMSKHPLLPRAHWFLAVICFPGLEDLQQEPLSPDSPFPAWLEEAESSLDKCFLMDYTSPNPMSLFFSPPGSSTRGQPGPEAPDCDLTIGVRLCVCSNGGGGEELESVMKELSVSPTTTGLIKKQLLSGE